MAQVGWFKVASRTCEYLESPNVLNDNMEKISFQGLDLPVCSFCWSVSVPMREIWHMAFKWIQVDWLFFLIEHFIPFTPNLKGPHCYAAPRPGAICSTLLIFQRWHCMIVPSHVPAWRYWCSCQRLWLIPSNVPPRLPSARWHVISEDTQQQLNAGETFTFWPVTKNSCGTLGSRGQTPAFLFGLFHWDLSCIRPQNKNILKQSTKKEITSRFLF